MIAVFHRPIILEEIPSIFTHSFSISIDEIVNSLGKSLHIITFTTESKTIVSCNGTYICICICSCQHRISRCQIIKDTRWEIRNSKTMIQEHHAYITLVGNQLIFILRHIIKQLYICRLLTINKSFKFTKF